MEKFICQADEYCENCGEEMPKGYSSFISEEGDLLCQDCGEESIDENSGITFREHLEDIKRD